MSKNLNLSQSIHQRLKNEAKRQGRLFNDLLMHYAIERFLFRMGKSSYKDQFVLKGAFALNMIYQYYPGATRDIDFLCMSPSLKR